jgi:hypothetical protein
MIPKHIEAVGQFNASGVQGAAARLRLPVWAAGSYVPMNEQ